MEPKDPFRELEEEIEKIESELFKLPQKKGEPPPPEWKNWFDIQKGDPRMCGVALTNFISLDLDKAKKLFKEYVQKVVESLAIFKRKGWQVGDVENAISDFFAKLIREKKAVGFICERELLEKLYVLTGKTLKEVSRAGVFFVSDFADDEKINRIIDTTISDLDNADSMIEDIDEKYELEKLDERDREVIKLHKKGMSERDIVKETGVPKTTVHSIIERWNAKKSS